MTRNKLLELYQKLLEEGINVGDLKPLRTYKDEDIDIILNSKYPSVMINIIPNYEFKLLNSEQRSEIINLINNAKNKDIATAIYNIVRSKTVLSSGLTYELVKIICNSKESSAKYAVNTALNVNVLLNKNALELVRIVGSSNEEYQASSAADVATNIEVLMSGNAVELTKIASLTEGEEQSLLVNSIAKNRDVISSGLSIKLTNLGSKVKSDIIANLIKNVAINKILEKHKRSVYYLTRMLSTENDEDFFKLYDEVQKLINYINEQEKIAKNDKTLFWNLYKTNPEEAISLLRTKVNSKDEVTPYTRVRSNKK